MMQRDVKLWGEGCAEPSQPAPGAAQGSAARVLEGDAKLPEKGRKFLVSWIKVTVCVFLFKI